MKSRSLIILFYLLVLWIFPAKVNAQADVHLSIFKEVKKKISIAIPAFLVKETNVAGDNTASEGANILKNDLNLSGMFDIIDFQRTDQINRLDLNEDAIHYSMWTELGANALIKGEYAASENGITVKLSLFDVAKKRYLIGKRYRDQKFRLRQIMHKFADETVYYLTNEKGIAQTKIAFVAFQSGHKELFVIDYDGYKESLKQLSNEQSLVLFPNWSPDGRKIVYT